MRDIFRNLFLPRSSNNHRASLLHHKALLITTVILILGSFLLVDLRTRFPYVLGISSDISSEQLLLLTNQKRQENGLAPLTTNPQLAQAAAGKAQDMFALNYWAHNAPDGKTPWVFIKSTGYSYIYAGENLARGFNNASDVVNAWMASPEHRKNMLSGNYKDIGFAVATGKLNGEETILVVEMFGSTNLGAVAKEERPVAVATSSSANAPVAKEVETPNTKTTTEVVASKSFLGVQKSPSQPLINSISLSSFVTRFVIALFIFILILDMVVVERKKIVRLVGHNLDHIFFLTLMFIIVTFIIRGAVV